MIWLTVSDVPLKSHASDELYILSFFSVFACGHACVFAWCAFVHVCLCVCVCVCACVVRVCVLRASVSSPGLVASGHFPQEFPSADHTQVHGGLLYLLRSEGKATTPLTPLHHTTNTVDFAALSRDCLDAPEANS